MKFIPLYLSYTLCSLFLAFNTVSFAQTVPVTTSEKAIQFETSFVEAMSLILNEKHKDAVLILEKLFSEDRRNAAIAFELAKCYNKLSNPEKSYDYLDRAIRYDSENPWYQIMKAKMLEEDARYAEAVDVYSNLIILDPDAFEFYKQKANNLARIEKYTEAAEVLALFENRIGSDEELHQRKFDLYTAAGMQTEAWNEIRKLHLINQYNTDYIYLLASFAAQAGNQPEADSLLNVILAIDPSNTRAGLALSRQQKNGNSETAYLRSLQTIFKNKNADSDAKIIELIPFVQNLDPSKKELFQELKNLGDLLLEAHPENAKVHSIRGDIFKLYGNSQEAISEYKKSLRYSQAVFEVWEALVTLEYQSGSIDDMMKTIDRALDYFPNQANLYIWNGLGNIAQNKTKQALADFDQAIMMSAGNPEKQGEIWQHKGAAYIKDKSFDNADKSFTTALELTSGRVDILCYSLYQTGLIKEAQPIAGKLIKQYPPENINVPMYHALVARYLAASGQLAQGTKWMDKALKESNASDPFILEYAGDVQLLSSQQEEARKYWQLAVEKGGDSERIGLKIKNMKVYE
jgi:tetratricopeptide (TPR) repeat protein